jgi:hypothetical protein
MDTLQRLPIHYPFQLPFSFPYYVLQQENRLRDSSGQNSYSDYYLTELLASLAPASSSKPYPNNEATRQQHRIDTLGSDSCTFSLSWMDNQKLLKVPVHKERIGRSRERNNQSNGPSRGGSPLPSMEPDELYDTCDGTGPNLTYCNVCNTNLCSDCWPRQAPHRKQRLAPGSILHERTNIAVAKKIQKILVPTSKPGKLTQLHEEDEKNVWFGTRSSTSLVATGLLNVRRLP